MRNKSKLYRLLIALICSVSFLFTSIYVDFTPEPSVPKDSLYIPVEDSLPGPFTLEGKKRLSEEPTDQSAVDSFIDIIISKSGEAITGGIQVYAKAVVLNLLKECGLDLRDATTKTLENIQTQLGIIETKVDAIVAKQEQYHSEDVLSKVLDRFVIATGRYIPYVTQSLTYLVDLENDETLSEDEIEAARQNTYNKGINNLVFDGAPFATYVTELASWVLQPNTADPRKDVFYYYDHTIGLCDKWTSQYYRNVKNFIAYLDSTLIMLSNLAKFQIYYKAKEADEGIRRAYVEMMNNMANAVNAVNLSFANKLTELNYIKYDLSKGLTKYVATNEYYSLRMATLTYDLSDKGYGDSRQGLLLGYTNDSGGHGLHQVSYCYQPNQSIVSSVAADYRSFAGDYCSSSYTINEYLKSIGFWAKDVELFDKAAGLFNGDMYVDKHGFMNDDFDYSISYYNQYGNYTRKNAFEVVSYHTWYGGIKRTELRANDTNYYLCFGRKNADYTVSLDGSYRQTYMWDVMFTVNNVVYFKPDYRQFIDKPGPIVYHDRW